MTHEKRRYPILLWIFAFLLSVLIIAGGLYFIWQNNAGSSLPSGTFHALDSAFFAWTLPLVYTALIAACLCLAVGFILGGLLALAKHRTGILIAATPILILAGGLLFFFEQLALYLPQSLSDALIQAGGNLPPSILIAIILLPLMMLCISSFTLSLDPHLYQAAISLGTSPAGAYTKLLFPRLVLKAVPCYIAILPCAFSLALANSPLLDFSVDILLILYIALISATLILLFIICLITRKPRRISPC